MILPYISVIGAGVATSVGVGNKAAPEGGFNYGASTLVGLASTITSSVCNSTMEKNYDNLMDRQKTQTTSSYVQQLSDDELESALIKFDLLEKDNNNNVKVL